MTEQPLPRVDIYASIITARDFSSLVRGWDSASTYTTTPISRCTAKQVVPDVMKSLIPPTSQTLSHPPSEPTHMLPPDVQLRIKCNNLLSTALKFAWPFTTPVPFTTEQDALVCYCKKITPKIILRITLRYNDVQGIASPQLNIGSEYTIKKITATDTTRHSGASFDFMTNGRVVQRFGASTIDISDKPFDSRRSEAKSEIDIIEAQQPIASVWLHSNMLASVFPIKKVKDDMDKNITITPAGIKIDGLVEGREAKLELSCDPNASTGVDYGFYILPKTSISGQLMMTGLSQLGRFTSTASGGAITLTFYDKLSTSSCYYVRIEVPFSQMSAGDVYLSINSAFKQTYSSVSAPRAITGQDMGDQAPTFNPIQYIAPPAPSSTADTMLLPGTTSSVQPTTYMTASPMGGTVQNVPNGVNMVPASSLDFGEDVEYEEEGEDEDDDQ